jgi:hypothetical protein
MAKDGAVEVAETGVKPLKGWGHRHNPAAYLLHQSKAEKDPLMGSYADAGDEGDGRPDDAR